MLANNLFVFILETLYIVLFNMAIDVPELQQIRMHPFWNVCLTIDAPSNQMSNKCHTKRHHQHCKNPLRGKCGENEARNRRDTNC